jgi:hypothetical protein
MCKLFDFAKELVSDQIKNLSVATVDFERVVPEQDLKEVLRESRDAALWEINLQFEKARRGE